MGNPGNSKLLAEFAIYALLAIKVLRPRKFLFFYEPRQMCFVGIKANANHLETLCMIFVVCSPYVRQGSDTRNAGCPPEINQHHLASHFSQIDFATVERREFHRHWLTKGIEPIKKAFGPQLETFRSRAVSQLLGQHVRSFALAVLKH